MMVALSVFEKYKLILIVPGPAWVMNMYGSWGTGLGVHHISSVGSIIPE